MSSEITFRQEVDVLAEHVALDGKRVVDVGAGAGGLVRWLRRHGADPVGVECGEIMRERALAADPEHPDAYVDAGGEDLPFDDESADVVVLFRSLHHIPGDHMGDALTEAHRVLRPGGRLFVLEPVAEGPSQFVMELVDDETEVRAAAQAALAEASVLGFDLVTAGDFITQSVYADFDAFESNVVGIDPSRSAQMERHRETVRARFHDHGHRTETGYAFPQPHVFQVLAKRSRAPADG